MRKAMYSFHVIRWLASRDTRIASVSEGVRRAPSSSIQSFFELIEVLQLAVSLEIVPTWFRSMSGAAIRC